VSRRQPPSLTYRYAVDGSRCATMLRTILSRVADFLGVTSLNSVGRDAYIIITLRSLRMFTAGIPSLILALFFSSLKFPDSRIGVFMTLTLLGDVLLSLILTLVADKLGRRRILFMGSVMMTCSGVVFALSERQVHLTNGL
jgi:MFS family permease